MDRLISFLMVAVNMVAGGLILSAQGTVHFSNVGRGINAPVSGPDGLLGPDFTAQLQLADGTNVGDPVAFLADGLFSGGVLKISGIPSGSSVNLKVAVSNEDGSVAGHSNVFTVLLGGGSVPPLLPGLLDRLEAFTIERLPPAPYLGWASYPSEVPWCFLPFWTCDELIPANTVVCALLGTDAISLLRVDDCQCAHLPYPEGAVPEQLPRPCGHETNGGIGIRLQDDGFVELRWPVGKSLYQSRVLGDIDGKRVESEAHVNGSQVKSIKVIDMQMFFWLE